MLKQNKNYRIQIASLAVIFLTLFITTINTVNKLTSLNIERARVIENLSRSEKNFRELQINKENKINEELNILLSEGKILPPGNQETVDLFEIKARPQNPNLENNTKEPVSVPNKG